MRSPLAHSIVCALLSGAVADCGSPQHNVSSAATSTRYRVGDYVVYRYSGTFSAQPVTLREEVTSQVANHLAIEVELRRGDEVRRWVQHVTDTPENQRANAIESLEEISPQGRVLLANRDNADLYRLYEGTFIVPDGRATGVETHDEREAVAGTTYACRVRTGANVWRGRPVRFRESECPDFLWTHASADWRAAPVDASDGGSATDETVYRVEVVESGRRSPR